jgi:hypothetical protein
MSAVPRRHLEHEGGAGRLDLESSALRSGSVRVRPCDLDAPTGPRRFDTRSSARAHPVLHPRQCRTAAPILAEFSQNLAIERGWPEARRAQTCRKAAEAETNEEERTPKMSTDIVRLLSCWGPTSRADLWTMGGDGERVKRRGGNKRSSRCVRSRLSSPRVRRVRAETVARPPCLLPGPRAARDRRRVFLQSSR